MLLQVKASLNHGEWLPWLNGEIESGRLTVKTSQAHKYMRIASNLHRSVNLLESTSINAALELLSDKEQEEQQGSLIDLETERQARAAVDVGGEDVGGGVCGQDSIGGGYSGHLAGREAIAAVDQLPSTDPGIAALRE